MAHCGSASIFESVHWKVEARDGIEPPKKVLQTFPFSFWAPRHFLQRAVLPRTKTPDPKALCI